MFVKEKEIERKSQGEELPKDSELSTLSLIKLFIAKNHEFMQEVTKDTAIYGFDCMSMSVTTCLLANRKGFKVKIGRPDKFSRYCHALILRGNGSVFKITGKRTDYEVKEMYLKDVQNRIKYIKPVVNFVNSVTKKLKK